jgi:catechol 2,3-dioxygenase-like lactoylglutathione lyase family enzyme
VGGKLIPTLRCSDMKKSVSFYKDLLGFELFERWPERGDPAFAVLVWKEEDELHLSSHSGDGVFGSVVSILTSDVDGIFSALKKYGMTFPVHADSPVHSAPVDQTWGTRELYVNDPDGNVIRFVQREP